MRRALWIPAMCGCFAACSAATPPGRDPGAMHAALAVAALGAASTVPAESGPAPGKAAKSPTGAAHPARPCAPPRGAVAWLACDGRHIRVADPIVAHPGAPLPATPTRAVLDAVAALMGKHPGIHLLRIEAYSSLPPGSDDARIRREIDRSQERADAVFRYLWRTRHVSPERMEAVGLGWVRSHARAGQRWPIELRVVQRTGGGSG